MSIFRTGFLFVVLCIGTLFQSDNEKVIPVKSFTGADVLLKDWWIKQRENLNRTYLHRIDIESLLHNFRVNAGLPSSAKPPEGWESPECGLRGHFTGHYLSACAAVIRINGDSVLAKRIGYMIDVLADCQQRMGDKYLSTFGVG